MPTTLILTMAGLLFLLIVLVSTYVWITRRRSGPAEVLQKIETFESLIAIIRNHASTTPELQYASERIIEHFGAVTPQTLSVYQELIGTLCTHPHIDSKILLQFEKSLRKANPHYTHDIEHALTKGLAKRG